LRASRWREEKSFDVSFRSPLKRELRAGPVRLLCCAQSLKAGLRRKEERGIAGIEANPR
jgi:hypothetical protein